MWLVVPAAVVVVAIVMVLQGGDEPTVVPSSDAPLPPAITSSVSPSSSAPPAEAVPLSAAKAAMGGARSVLVLGDSTGNSIDEWVALWGRSMTDVRTMMTRQWDAKVERFAPEFTHLGGHGPELTLWNLSQPGALADYPVTRLTAVKSTPDLVIYSFGHNDTFTDIGPHLDATAQAVAKRWGDVPQVVILQNPTTGKLALRDSNVTAYLRTTWAPEHGAATIDVEKAFLEDGRPLQDLLRDTTHPNAAGSELWARVVAKALSPR